MGMHQPSEHVQALESPCACNTLYASPGFGSSGSSKVQQIVSWTAKLHISRCPWHLHSICCWMQAMCRRRSIARHEQEYSQQLQTHSWQWR